MNNIVNKTPLIVSYEERLESSGRSLLSIRKILGCYLESISSNEEGLMNLGLNLRKLIARKQFYRQSGLPVEINNLIEEKYREDLKEYQNSLRAEGKFLKMIENSYFKAFSDVVKSRNLIKSIQDDIIELEREKQEAWEKYLLNKKLPNINYSKGELPVINKELPSLPQSKLTRLENKIKKLTNKVIRGIKKNHFIAQIQVITTRN